jgi:YebC/PmpR family DNA-binding regulatory protein
MAGHSHSANIARRKGAVDKKRAREFSKCAKAILSAVKQAGPDPDANLKLKYAIEKAKASNMPKENIQRVIKSALGDKSGSMEELVYEGYAPGGVAVMVTAVSDNRHRTSADIKHIFDKRGGNLGAQGSVGFQFNLRSIFVIEARGRSEEQLMELALEVGADDVELDGELATLQAAPTEFLTLKSKLEACGSEFLSAEMGYLPLTSAALTDRDEARRVLRLLDELEELDDVQSVYANYTMDPAWLEDA